MRDGLVRINKTKAKARAGEMAFGAAVSLDSADTVEVIGALGFDYVTFDLEHEAFDEKAVVNCIRAAETYDLTPIVRVPYNPDLILRMLDAGAQGIHVTRINDKVEVQSVVEACLFHPQGKRSFFATARSGNFGIGLTEEEYAEQSNKETIVMVQVEEVSGLRNMGGIVSVPSVDAIQVGPKDLWQSMGMPDRETVQKAVERIITSAVRGGRWASMYAWDDEDLEEQIVLYKRLGVRFVTVSARQLLIRGGQSYLARCKKAIG